MAEKIESKTFTAKACIGCGKITVIELITKQDIVAWHAWQSGWPVQAAFQHWTADERGLLISGTHPACWAEMFGSKEN